MILHALQQLRLQMHKFRRQSMAALEPSQEALADLVVGARWAQPRDVVPRAATLDHGSNEHLVLCDVPLQDDRVSFRVRIGDARRAVGDLP